MANIDWASHVRGIPGSTGGNELASMVNSGDFTAYKSPYLRGEQEAAATHLSTSAPGKDLRVIEVFTFPEGAEADFRAHHDALYAWRGTGRIVGDALVPPLGTLMALLNVPDGLLQAVMKGGYHKAPKFADRDVLYVTDKGLFHQGATGGFYNRGRSERDQSQGLLRWDDIKGLPAEARDGLKGPGEPLTCQVGVGLLVTMAHIRGPSFKAPEGMVSFQLQSVSTKSVAFGNRYEQRPAHMIPINDFQAGSANNPHPRAYPNSALLYKLIEAGMAGKLPQ